MSGDHDHHHHGSSDNLKVAFFLNFGFTILEIIGGFWTNSIAILTDAVHDLGDSISLGLAWYFDKLSHRERTPRHTFGYRRFRLLGGLITGVMLLLGLGFVLYHAVGRLTDPQEVRAPGMLALAVLGVLFNGAAVLHVKSGTSLTEKLVSWHLIEDTLGWLAVLIGAGIMMVWDVPIVDPILSISISMIVLWNVGRNLKKVFSVMLQATPDSFDAEAFETDVLAIDGIESVHHIHCWSIDGESHVLSAHLVLDAADVDVAKIKEQVRDLVDSQDFEHITLETERPGEPCPQNE
ncbi:MAG: cation transporter [Verrucomicrobiales bacterium]|nr:cation transporter [Verrucomicrobiales bacterium]